MADDAGQPTPPAPGLPAAPRPRPAASRSRLPRWVGEGAVWTAVVVLAAGALAVPPMVAQQGYWPEAAAVLPPEGPVIVGIVPYDGPDQAEGILASCQVNGSTDFDCIAMTLDALLMARGSEKAFTELENLTFLDRAILEYGHPLAHGMGRTAVEAYGGPRTALQHCPYVLASGCFHGVLQSYFDTLDSLTPAVVQSLCPPGDDFWRFQCLHGMGHGLDLYTNYDLKETLRICDFLGDQWAIESCQGGAFMENLVGYLDSLHPTPAGGHNHDGPERPPPVFMLNHTDPSYPCNALPYAYLKSCYFFQSSIVMFLYNGDFNLAINMCLDAPKEFWQVCFMSVGRDAFDRAHKDPVQGSAICQMAGPEGAGDCIRGFVAAIINEKAAPEPGIEDCMQVPTDLKEPCYHHVGQASITLATPEHLARVCATAEEGYEQSCRAGARLPAM